MLKSNSHWRSLQFHRPGRSSVSLLISRQSSLQRHLRPGMIVLLFFLAVFLNMAAVAAHRSLLQQGIAEEVLRFHVLANSDSAEDQAVKYLVRDAILAWAEAEMDADLITNEPERNSKIFMQEIYRAVEAGTIRESHTSWIYVAGLEEEYGMENTDETDENGKCLSTKIDIGKEETLKFYSENIDQIEAIANAVLAEQGMSYQAKAEICQSYFPDRTYGEYTFPAGWYQALRICLGEAKGQNWWCLLYPGLCFSDALHAVIEDDGQESLEEILTVEEYQSLLKTPSRWRITFRWLNF